MAYLFDIEGVWPCRAATPTSPSRAGRRPWPCTATREPARRGFHLVRPRPAFRPAGRHRPGHRLARGGLAGGSAPGLQADHPVLPDRLGPARLGPQSGATCGSAVGRRAPCTEAYGTHLTRPPGRSSTTSGCSPSAQPRLDTSTSAGPRPGPTDDHRPGRAYALDTEEQDPVALRARPPWRSHRPRGRRPAACRSRTDQRRRRAAAATSARVRSTGTSARSTRNSACAPGPRPPGSRSATGWAETAAPVAAPVVLRGRRPGPGS